MTLRERLKGANFIRRTEGSAAVEFAMLIIPFIYMTFAIIELGLFFAASNMMEGGISASARVIKTGQLQQQADPQTAFEQEVCRHLFVLIDCDKVGIEVVTIPDDDFSGVGNYEPIYDSAGKLVPRSFNAGQSNDVVMIRATYRYKLLTPLFADIFSKEDDHTVPLMTTIVLQTEPYDFTEESGGT